ncbi:hypothetical protein ACLSU7_17335 [Bdellovibrio sp. HCB185ZH]|uniref:hypothetical protein n=1 Tax=Bdellovibrio sp. HCB185ZH TaxID=3394235 RepID=UPI0039A6A9AB
MSLNQLFESTNDQIIIEAISDRVSGKQGRIDDLIPNAMDLAILHAKPSVVSYLLLRGFSPFSISQESYNILEYDSRMSLVRSAQKDRTISLLRLFPIEKDNARNFENFNEELLHLKLGSHGCQMAVETLFDIRHFTDKEVNYSLYNRVDQDIPTDEAIRYIISQSSCREQASNFPIASTQEWLAHEFILQFQIGFKNIEFVKWLSEKFSVGSVSIVVPNSMAFGASQIKIDPVSMVLLKKSCLGGSFEQTQWLELAKKLRGDINSYVYPIRINVFEDETRKCAKVISEIPEVNMEKHERTMCSKLVESLAITHSLLNNQPTDFETFTHLWSKMVFASTDEDSTKFLASLCRGAVR